MMAMLSFMLMVPLIVGKVLLLWCLETREVSASRLLLVVFNYARSALVAEQKAFAWASEKAVKRGWLNIQWFCDAKNLVAQILGKSDCGIWDMRNLNCVSQILFC